MSQKNWTPFDSILGCYSYPQPVRHHKIESKSYLFIGDKWQAIGDIEFIYAEDSNGEGFIHMISPDPKEYATDHESEGALDWLNWGPRLN